LLPTSNANTDVANTEEGEIGDMQVNATASSSSISICSLDTTLTCEESVGDHGGDFGKVYKHIHQLDNENIT